MLRRLKQTYRRWLRGRDALRIECERRLLDHQSFEEAESFAWVLCPPIEILKTGYPEDIRRAVSVACVVSYARPFSGQRDRFGESERDLRFEKLYRSQLSDPEDRALHNRMLKLRHLVRSGMVRPFSEPVAPLRGGRRNLGEDGFLYSA